MIDHEQLKECIKILRNIGVVNKLTANVGLSAYELQCMAGRLTDEELEELVINRMRRPMADSIARRLKARVGFDLGSNDTIPSDEEYLFYTGTTYVLSDSDYQYLCDTLGQMIKESLMRREIEGTVK